MQALCWRKKLCSCINKIILPNNSTTTRERSWMIEGKKRQAIRRHSGIIMWSGPRNMLGKRREKKKKSKPLSKLTMIHFVDLDHGLEKKSIDRLPATANGSQQVSLIVCEFNSSAIFFILLHGNHQNRYGSAGIHKPFNAVSWSKIEEK